jgi:hypothetical protein
MIEISFLNYRELVGSNGHANEFWRDQVVCLHYNDSLFEVAVELCVELVQLGLYSSR